jgi:CHAT domain-containing protein
MEHATPASRNAAVERYLEDAVAEWLPDREARPALQSLASVLQSEHEDAWLSDFLQQPDSAPNREGASALSQAARWDQSSGSSQSESEARRAVRAFHVAGNTAGEIRARVETAYALRRSVQGAAALTELEQLRPMLSGRRYTWISTQFIIEIALCQYMLGRFEEATRSIDAAIESAGRYHFLVLRLRAQGMAGSIADGRAESALAWARNTSGLREFWSAPYPRERGYQFLNDLSILARREGTIRAAADFEREAVLQLAATEHAREEAMARFQLATLESASGDRGSQAAQEFDRAGKLFGSLPPTQANRTLALYSQLEMVAASSSGVSVADALARVDRLRSQMGEHRSALVELLLLRVSGELHERAGDIRAAESDWLGALSIAERSRLEARAGRDRELWVEQNASLYHSLTHLYLRTKNEPERAWRVWREFRTGAAQDVPLERAPLARLSYVEFTDGVAIGLASKGSNQSFWRPVPQPELRSLARRFAALCADPHSSEPALRRDGRRLYDLLLAQVAEYLPEGATLTVDPDGVLSKIPFEALIDSHGKYAADQYRFVTIAPGKNRPKPSGPDRVVLDASLPAVIAGAPALDPELAAAFPPLPHAADEARWVASLFTNKTLLLGAKATPDALEQELARAGVFHFAGHAAEDLGLILSSGTLSPARIEKLALQCRLAVLSACSTSGSTSAGAGDSDSLARAFLLAGAGQVIATRWDIDSRSATPIIQDFYRSAIKGAPLSSALAEAERRLRLQPETAHPSYWAAFHLLEPFPSPP